MRLILAAASSALIACSNGPTGPGAGSLKLYVANFNANSITVYDAAATGNAAPTATIAGAGTGLNGPAGIALDGAGKLYVVNSTANSITIYPAGAKGNASPMATIAGDLTGLSSPASVALDRAGQVYVANAAGNSITVYATGATGNATPTATIAGDATELDHPVGVALDTRSQQHGGQHLYVLTDGLCVCIKVYSAGATGNASPITTITGVPHPRGVAVDTAVGLLYVGTVDPGANAVTVYSAAATGNATPTATIAGPGTGLNIPVGLGLDATGRLYVANPGIPASPGMSITVYPAGATGNATPIATITGANTGLNGPVGVALGP